MALIKLENIGKRYNGNSIFCNLNIDIEKGEFIGIKGASGAGKSTLLNIIGLLEESEGSVIIDGKKIRFGDARTIQRLLKNRIGYLFQNYALIEDLTVFENLRIVLEGLSKKQSRILMEQELNKVGIFEALDKKVYQLSGGEQQRVAVVRLLLHDCDIILADEPTGSLDKQNAKIILNLLKMFHDQGKTVVMVSHDEDAFLMCSRVLDLNAMKSTIQE